MRDIVNEHVAHFGRLDNLSDKVAIQLNDTHPAIAVAELMRILIDDHRLPWERAWELTVRTTGFTNHTLMPEALETWPVELFGRLLPRHLEVVREVDRRFRREVRTAFPDDEDRVEAMAVVDAEATIHMARLAIVGSHAVNGVAQLHTNLLRKEVVRDFADFFPRTLQQQDQWRDAPPVAARLQPTPFDAHHGKGRPRLGARSRPPRRVDGLRG
ncbi:MAG: glycogen/starch/alpha-glucan phosphorylase [Myxococcota bacterium]